MKNGHKDVIMLAGVLLNCQVVALEKYEYE